MSESWQTLLTGRRRLTLNLFRAEAEALLDVAHADQPGTDQEETPGDE